MSNRIKIFLLLISDVIALYASLFLTLIIRYGFDPDLATDANLIPFTIIFVIWLFIFFIAGLYDLRRLRDNLEFIKTLWLAIAISAVVSILIFYAIPLFGIAPKTNLFIFVIVFAIIETIWRRIFNRATASAEAQNRVLLIGNGSASEIEKNVRENPQLGYEISARLDESAAIISAPDEFQKIIYEKNINCVVVARSTKRESHLPATLYKLFAQGIPVIDLPNFYELVMRKVPLSDLEETWFLENIESAAQFYDPLKRAWEFLAALILALVLLPFEILIALVVVISSPGPIIYRQKRVGKNGHEFMLYKFRSMRSDAERQGAQWATKGDPRVTAFGRLLRASHLDELPQLWNVLRGDISFVGPRPERPEFVSKLQEQIPYYETRLLVKPGITGWAQINHRADLDLEDVRQKLQYDIYYLKNRSIVLDLAIIAKTVKSIFINPN